MRGDGYLGIARLALFCVLHHGFPWFSAPLGPKFKRGDHFLQADFSGLIPPSNSDSFRFAGNPGAISCGGSNRGTRKGHFCA